MNIILHRPLRTNIKPPFLKKQWKQCGSLTLMRMCWVLLVGCYLLFLLYQLLMIRNQHRSTEKHQQTDPNQNTRTDNSCTCFRFVPLRICVVSFGEQKVSHLSELLDPAEIQQTAGHDSGGTRPLNVGYCNINSLPGTESVALCVYKSIGEVADGIKWVLDPDGSVDPAEVSVCYFAVSSGWHIQIGCRHAMSVAAPCWRGGHAHFYQILLYVLFLFC